MEIEVKIPSVGESIKEATIAQWFKHDGESVQKDEPLFAIETDKVTLEVVSPADGVLHIKIQEGETAAIGTLVAVIDAMAAQEKPEQKEGKEAIEETPAPADTPSMPPPAAAPKAEPPTERGLPEEKEPPVLSPAVRNLVALHRLNADDIEGTGRNGRITKADVLAHLEKREIQTESTPAKPAEEKPAPKTGTRTWWNGSPCLPSGSASPSTL